MNESHWTRLILYAIGFLVSFWALYGLDYAKLMRRGQSYKALTIHFLLSAAVGKLVGDFLLVLIGKE